MPVAGRGERGDDEDTRSGAPAVRPFLGRPPGPVAAAGPPPADGGGGAVRPYYLTGGRVARADGRVRVETVVVAAVPARAHRLPAAAWEHQRLLGLAAEPTSVVELAAAMGVPVGVVLVLVGDLARDGLLDLSTPSVAPRDDVSLIRRLIDGVCAL
jgi:hypothetical protein